MRKVLTTVFPTCRSGKIGPHAISSPSLGANALAPPIQPLPHQEPALRTGAGAPSARATCGIPGNVSAQPWSPWPAQSVASLTLPLPREASSCPGANSGSHSGSPPLPPGLPCSQLAWERSRNKFFGGSEECVLRLGGSPPVFTLALRKGYSLSCPPGLVLRCLAQQQQSCTTWTWG